MALATAQGFAALGGVWNLLAGLGAGHAGPGRGGPGTAPPGHNGSPGHGPDGGATALSRSARLRPQGMSARSGRGYACWPRLWRRSRLATRGDMLTEVYRLQGEFLLRHATEIEARRKPASSRHWPLPATSRPILGSSVAAVGLSPLWRLEQGKRAVAPHSWHRSPAGSPRASLLLISKTRRHYWRNSRKVPAMPARLCVHYDPQPRRSGWKRQGGRGMSRVLTEFD